MPRGIPNKGIAGNTIANLYVHVKGKRVKTMSLCGLGYSWETTIKLTDNSAEVTCGRCKTLERK